MSYTQKQTMPMEKKSEDSEKKAEVASDITYFTLRSLKLVVPNTDYFNTSDVYCVLWHDDQQVTTETQNNNLEPTFDIGWTVGVSSRQETKKVWIAAYDKDSFTEDDYLGHMEINLEDHMNDSYFEVSGNLRHAAQPNLDTGTFLLGVKQSKHNDIQQQNQHITLDTIKRSIKEASIISADNRIINSFAKLVTLVGGNSDEKPISTIKAGTNAQAPTPITPQTLLGTKIEMPGPNGVLGSARTGAIKFLAQNLSETNYTDQWEDKQEAIDKTQALFKDRMPEGRPDGPWSMSKDMTTDEECSKLAFDGMGSCLLRRVPEPDKYGGLNPRYEVNLLSMQDQFPLTWNDDDDTKNDTFMHFGANAVFDHNRKILCIQRDEQISYPHSSNWEQFKYFWRCSVFTYVTMVTHAGRTHLGAANVIAEENHLDKSHPLQNLLRIITHGTREVNQNLADLLITKNGVMRKSGLPFETTCKMVQHGSDTVDVRSFKDQVTQQNGPPEWAYAQDGISFYEIVDNFVHDFLHVYWPDDNALQDDSQLQDYWSEVITRIPQDAKQILSSSLSFKGLQQWLTYTMFQVTAIHENVGTIDVITSDPFFACFAIHKDTSRHTPSPQMLTLLYGLVIATSGPMPKLLSTEWEPVIHEKMLPAWKAFQSKTESLALRIDTRQTPCHNMNPRNFECSVSM